MPLNNVIYTYPGTFIQENTAGVIPATLATHEAVYILGHSTKLGAPEGIPSFVTSPEDFGNVFGEDSLSYPSVALFFAQRSGAGLYFINVPAALAYPTLAEISAAIAGAFTTEDPQGFLLAPEFFQAGTLDHAALAGVLEAQAADPRFSWVALVDCGPAVAAAATPGDFVSLAKAQRLALASPNGHSWYYAPYMVALDDTEVPASAAIAGIAIRRMRNDGFKEPPAGVRYPVQGIKAVTLKADDKIQSQLNPEGINLVRLLPRFGVVVWGARTLSADPYYRHANNRVILNVLAGTYREAFHSLIFSAVDGLGVIFSRLKGTAVTIVEDLRKAGALFGATPKDAYRVICGLENNPGNVLDAGQVNLDVYVKVSPTLEFLGIRLNKVSLATDWSEIQDVNLSA